MFWSPTQLLIQGQWWSKRATHLPQPVLALVVVVQASQTCRCCGSCTSRRAQHLLVAALRAPLAGATVMGPGWAGLRTSGANHFCRSGVELPVAVQVVARDHARVAHASCHIRGYGSKYCSTACIPAGTSVDYQQADQCIVECMKDVLTHATRECLAVVAAGKICPWRIGSASSVLPVRR